MKNLKLFLWLAFLTGVAYPMLITLVAQLTMKQKADGDFVSSNGRIVGARLIAQKFEGDTYFWPRPSANDYNALSSGGSNLGPTSAILKKAVKERKAVLVKMQGSADAALIPRELLFSSGSGLDPHISPSTAIFQIDRIVKARGLNAEDGKEAIKILIDEFTEERWFGFVGEPTVNVFQLNIALDEKLKVSRQESVVSRK